MINLQWLEIAVDTKEEHIDPLCDKLENIGVNGFVIENEHDFKTFLEENRQYWDYVDEDFAKSIEGLCRIKFYLTADDEGRRLLGEIRASMPDEKISSAVIKDEDWANNWRRYYKPIKVGRRLLIVPQWEDVSDTDGRCVLRLDPGLIFGTGTHPTTRMCLCALENHASGANVLDLGCGSGILAIAALILGARKAVGCDIDDKAPDIVLANATLSSVEDRITVYAGDVLSDLHMKAKIGFKKYDLVLANIVADVIIPLSAQVKDYMTHGGRFICSGIIDGREAEVEAALKLNGFDIVKHMHEDNWHAFETVAADR